MPRPGRSALIALCFGAVSVAAFAPLGAFPLIGLTLAGLYGLLGAAARSAPAPANGRAAHGALLGGAFGFGFFLTGVSWVYVSLSTFGNMSAPLAAFATVLFCLFLSLYPALASAAFVRWARFTPGAWWQRALLFAAVWTLTEWLRGWLLTGFPWLAIGYAQTPPSPLAGFAPLFGVFGVSFLSVFCAALASEAAQAWPMRLRHGKSTASWLGVILPLLLGASLLFAGDRWREVRWTQPEGEAISVVLLQGNIAQDLKWRPEKFAAILRSYESLIRDHPAHLTVLPETAFPAFLDQLPLEYLDELKALARRKHGDLLFGIVTGDRLRYANSAIGLGSSSDQQYDKNHLVPFGEFIPPGFSWFLELSDIPMTEFTRGDEKPTPLKLAGLRVAVNICYEDAFGEEIIRALPEAALLVNISNVAWFGDSLAPAQHLQIARLRALETGRMMLRATNTGMTAIIDANGMIRAALEPFTRAVLRGEARGYAGETPYVRWGNWPVITLSGLWLLLAVRPGRRRTRESGS